jgi:hypothetical protein
MKIQRTTLVLLGSAILLGSFVYLSEIQGASQREAAKTTKQPIFSFKEEQIQSVIINLNDKTLEFERASGQPTNWRMKKPQDVPASDASIAFLSNLLVNGKSDRSFSIQANQLPEYGLDKPSGTVIVKLNNQLTHRLILGKPDFNRSFLYAQADPASHLPQQTVLLVPTDFEYALNRPMSEWQFTQDKPASPKPTVTPGNSTPSPTPNTTKPSPTPAGSKPTATPGNSTPSPTPNTTKPSPTPAGSKPTATPGNSTPSPTPNTTKPSPTPAGSKPTATSGNSTPSPTPNTTKASPTPGSSTPSAAPNTTKQSPTSGNPKPSPTAGSPKPSPTPDTSKQSPAQ